MLADSTARSGWRPDRKFWLVHLLLPAAASAAVLTLLEYTPVDLWLADRWFALEGDRWAWRDNWLTYNLIHHYGKLALIAFGIVLIGLIIASLRSAQLARWRLPMTYALTSMALVPAVIARAKGFIPVPCPWDLARYGGELAYLRTFEYSFGPADFGHCFPSGHASGGFALLTMYFAAFLYVRRPALMLLPGLVVGWVFAFGQQARGAHFISHDLWSMALCWFSALALFVLFRPHRWPAPKSGLRKPTEVPAAA